DTPGKHDFDFELANVQASDTVLLEATLDGQEDHFPLDDRAWLVLGVARKARVLVVTDGASTLRKPFGTEAVSRIAAVQFLTPPDLRTEKYRRPDRDGAFDLVVFDRCAPAAEEDLPLANTFFIDDMPPPWKRPTDTVKDVRILNPTSGHPLMQNLT